MGNVVSQYHQPFLPLLPFRRLLSDRRNWKNRVLRGKKLRDGLKRVKDVHLHLDVGGFWLSTGKC
jgi:hypothetical protein